MPSTIITKNSSTPGAVPVAGQLTKGELAVNVSDRRLYTKDNSGAVVEVGGSGTVTRYIDKFDGDDATVIFTLPRTPFSNAVVDIFISGVYQNKDTWSLSGDTIIFSEAPVAGTSNVEVITIQTSPIGETDASYVKYTQGSTGSVETTVNTKLQERVSVKDFGAFGNGSADDTNAISTAIDYAIVNKSSIYFPAGRYIVSSTLSKTLTGDGSISLIGEGENVTIIELNTSGNGIALTLSGNWYLNNAGGMTAAHFSNITFTTTNSNTGQGITLTGSSLAGRPGAKVSFESCEFRPKTNFSQGWSKAVVVTDCQDVWFNDCRFIQGGPTNVTAGGLFVNGTSVATSPTTVFVDHCEFLYGNIQLEVGDYVEGVYVTNCAMVGGVVGIRMDPTTGESGLHVMGGHINSTLYNIDLINVFDFELIGGLLYRSGTTANFNNVRIQSGGRFVISGNVFKGTNVADGEVAINVISTVNNEQQGGYIGNNSIHLYATRGIWLNAGANFVFVGDNLFRGCAEKVLNQATNTNNTVSGKVYNVTVARTLTGGTVTENIDLALPTGMFRIAPGAGLVEADAGSVLAVKGAYDFAASTASNARIVVRNPAGGNIAAGTYRFHVVLFEQSYASSH